MRKKGSESKERRRKEREKEKGLGKEHKDVGEMRSIEKENKRSRYSSRWMRPK